MSLDISGFGLQINLVASVTFPAGLPISQFADDADPFELESISILDKAMGLNGDLVTWAKAVPIPLAIAVIAGSDDDINLQILADANRVAQGKFSARDVITMTGIYPNDSSITLFKGRITDAMFGNSVAGSGRLKTKVYKFIFQDKVSASL